MSDSRIQELIDFVVGDRLFSGANPAPDECRLIETLGDAHRWAVDQPPDSPSLTDWTGLREHQAPQRLPESHYDTHDHLTSAIAFTLKRLGWARATNEVSADFELILRSRLTPGPSSRFWESVFALYKLGLWPCGWDGPKFPEGRFAVFRPSAPNFALDLPSDLAGFLEEGRQLKYAPEECEAGVVTLHPLDELRAEFFPTDLQSSSVKDDDPRKGQLGCYLVPAVDLIQSAEHYEPTGLLLWLPTERRFGTWDSSHQFLSLFDIPDAWAHIVHAPTRFINAQWEGAHADSAKTRPVIPWPRYPYSPRQIFEPQPISLERADGVLFEKLLAGVPPAEAFREFAIVRHDLSKRDLAEIFQWRFERVDSLGVRVIWRWAKDSDRGLPDIEFNEAITRLLREGQYL